MENVTTTTGCLSCKGCCYFVSENEDSELAPYFTEKELLDYPDKTFFVKKNGFFQVKLKKAIEREGFVCPFLDEKTYRCIVYKKRPFDCISWPFVLNRGKDEKDCYLSVVDKKWCPAVDIDEINRSGVANRVLSYIEKTGIIEEIKEGKRFVWPYEEWYINLKKIEL